MSPPQHRRWQPWLCVSLGVAILTVGSVAGAAPVLPGSATKRIEAALEGTAKQTGLPLSSGKIQRDRVLARWCDGPACFDATLTAPGTCSAPAGPFCVTWGQALEAPAPQRLVTALTAQLKTLGGSIWQQPSDGGVSKSLQRALRQRGAPPPPKQPAALRLPKTDAAPFQILLGLGVLGALALAIGLRRPPQAPGSGPAPSGVRSFALASSVLFGVLSLGVHHAWPLFVMDVYSYAYTSASQIIALDPDGRVHNVRTIRQWRCDALPEHDLIPSREVCGHYDDIGSRDLFRLAHIRNAPAPSQGARRFRLVRRVWRFEGTAIEQTDCPITVCEVRP